MGASHHLARATTAGRRREVGASVVAIVAVLAVVGACGFVAYRFFAAGAKKSEIEKEAAEVVERAFGGRAITKIANDFKTFASERGCEATDGSPRIALEPSENPDKVSLTFDCALPVNLLVVKLAKRVRIDKTRERSAAFRTLQDVKARIEGAHDKHDQRIEQRFRGAE
jgi:hypothetical protein